MRIKAAVWVSAICVAAAAQAVDLVPVLSKRAVHTLSLPGEFEPYERVSIRAQVAGRVERVLVDRGSRVKRGQLLIELAAPEMKAEIAEAESRVAIAEADRAEAESRLSGLRSTAERMKEAAQTPGAVAGNELVQANQQVQAAEALVRSREQVKHQAEATLGMRKDMDAYLRITAPFDGVVTERLAHPGAIAGPPADLALLTVEQVSRLRLVVALPEAEVGGVAGGAIISFHVPAFPGRNYTGKVARVAHALNPQTRTMAVELEVANPDGSLSPGMYPTVSWTGRGGGTSMFVPKSSVVITTERTFVIVDRGGRAAWVDVRKGAAEGDLVEVMGALKAGDRVVGRGTDELREGSPLK